MGKKEPLSKWELALLGEQATLVTLCQTWHIFCQVTAAEIEKHGDNLDDELLECMIQVYKQVAMLLYNGAIIETEDGKQHQIGSMSHFLEDVNDEILALNPGLPCKRGIKYENGGDNGKEEEKRKGDKT